MMNTKSLTDAELLQLLVDKRVKDFVHTSFPAKITRVNDNNTVDVLPLVSTLLGDGSVKFYQELFDVRMQTYACQLGDVYVSLPIREGDLVWVMVSERDTAALMESDGDITPLPTSSLHHDLSDCFAIPAFFPDKRKKDFDKDNLVIANKTTKIVVKDNEVEITTDTCTINATDVAVNASNMVVNATLQVNGDTALNGSVEAVGSSFTHNGKNVGATHTHIGVQTGSGTSGVPS